MSTEIMTASELCMHTVKKAYDSFVARTETTPEIKDLQVGHEYSIRTVIACLERLGAPYSSLCQSKTAQKAAKKGDERYKGDTKILRFVADYSNTHPFGPSIREIASHCECSLSKAYSDMLYLAVSGKLEFYPEIGRSVHLGREGGDLSV